jgi:hypothetical protein
MNRKTTLYFQYMRLRQDRVAILDEWIEGVLTKPIKQTVQPDGRIRFWGKAPNGRYLRVVVLEDGETVHNAFFDRRFREETVV